MKPFVLIVGPTASGKSALALELARRYRGAILNCDSLQTYKRLDIGTAKPTADECASVPHFLFDYLPPGSFLTAGDFRRDALEVLNRELISKPVFGVGGSGFYIQALEKGMFDSPKADPATEKAVRDEMKTRGAAEMYKELQKLDPEYSATISPNDAYRLTRALIVIRDTGRKLSDLRKEFKPEKLPFPLLKLGLAPDRATLLMNVEIRTKAMIQAGLVEEVRVLKAEGFGDWPALQSVGYKETLLHLNGEIDLARLEFLINEKTMQLAKKQKTWFKRDPEIHWLESETAVEIASRLLDTMA